MIRGKGPRDAAVDKYPPLTMSPCKIKALLPSLRGVSGLSITEIKDDLRALHPPSDDNDTDSDSSILSDDILDSVYPVQPRSAPRSALQLQDQFSSGNNVSVDEAMYLIRDISKSHKELFEKEKLREEWEIRCEAYEANLQMEKDKFSSSRREYENYIKLLQGLFARTARLHSSHARHNALLYTIHQGLQQLQAAERLVAAECDKLKSHSKAARPGKTLPDTVAVGDGSTPVLKVYLQKRNADLLLHVGMTVPTPMGDGIVEKIFPDSNKLVVKLPYGLMYAHLPRAVNWFNVATDTVDASNMLESAAGLHGVQQRFHQSLEGCIFPPRAEAAAIRALVAQQRRGEEEIGALTDNDEASVDGSEVGETSAASVSDQPPSQVDPIAAMDVADADGEDDPFMLRSSSTRRNGDASSGEQPSAFPLPVFSTSPPARSGVRKALEAELCDEYAAILLHSLPLAFAPAAAIPHVVSELYESPGSRNPLRLSGVDYEVHSLQSLYASYPALHAHHAGDGAAPSSSDAATQPGATGSLAWQGDVPHLRESLQSLDEEIRELQREQQRRISEIDRVRRQGAQLTTEAASIRLNMFTRRLAHRTNLSNRGIVLPVAAPAPSQSSKARSSNQNRSNNNHNGNGAGSSSGNGNGSSSAGGDAGALALLLAAGESRSSRSKKAASAKNEETSGANDGFDGFARKSQLLRASADSPFSGNHSLAGDAPGTGDGVHAVASAANNRRRGAAATMLYKEDTSAASNKRSRAPASSNSRRAAEDIVASSGEPEAGLEEEGGDNEGNESDSGGSKSGARGGNAASAAANKKKAKRRKY